jgi:hypothetical protein
LWGRKMRNRQWPQPGSSVVIHYKRLVSIDMVYSCNSSYLLPTITLDPFYGMCTCCVPSTGSEKNRIGYSPIAPEVGDNSPNCLRTRHIVELRST